MNMHARTLTVVFLIRFKSDSASLSWMGFGRSMSVWVGVNRGWDALGGGGSGLFVFVRNKLSLHRMSVDIAKCIVVSP